MQFSFVPVFISSVVIIKSIGDVAALLNLGDKAAGSDGVNSAGGDKKDVVLVGRNVTKELCDLICFKALADGFFIHIHAKAVDDA